MGDGDLMGLSEGIRVSSFVVPKPEEVLAYLLVFESASLQLGLLCLGHCIFFGVCVSASIFIDTVLRTRIYALLDNADAESLVSSFARVLRGVCDGEVLLDSQMNVAKDAFPFGREKGM